MWNHDLVIPQKGWTGFFKKSSLELSVHPPGPTVQPRHPGLIKGVGVSSGCLGLVFHLGWRVLIITLPQMNIAHENEWWENDIFLGGWPDDRPVFSSSYVSFREFGAFDPSQTWVNYIDYIAMEALQCTYHVSSYVNVRHWWVTNMCINIYIYTYIYCAQMLYTDVRVRLQWSYPYHLCIASDVISCQK